MPRSRRATYCLARLYLELGAHTQSLLTIFDLLRSSTSTFAVKAELNYGEKKSLEATRDRLEGLTKDDIEQILAIDREGEVAFAVAKEPREGSSCISVVACWNAVEAYGAPRKLIADLDAAHQVTYGYAYIAPNDVSPISETPLRKRWFCQSVRVPKHREGWLSPTQSVLTGGVRGIYPLNYWNQSVHTELQALGVKVPPALEGRTGLVDVDDEAARAIRFLNPNSSVWLRGEA